MEQRNSPIISLLLPTRERPELCKRFLDSVANTTVNLNAVEVLVYADDDDLASQNIRHDIVNTKVMVGPRTTMGTYNTTLFNLSQGDIIMLVNDDMVMSTHGWDEALRKVHLCYEDGIYLAYGNDLFKKGNLCTFPIISRRCYEVIGKPFHPTYKGAFIDYHIMEIFKRLSHQGFDRIVYLENIVFEHLHYRTGKGEIDAVYTQRSRFGDDHIFINLIEERIASAERLANALDSNGNIKKTVRRAITDYNSLNVITAPFFFFRVFILDRGLPLKWRSKACIWFMARFYVSKLFTK